MGLLKAKKNLGRCAPAASKPLNVRKWENRKKKRKTFVRVRERERNKKGKVKEG